MTLRTAAVVDNPRAPATRDDDTPDRCDGLSVGPGLVRPVAAPGELLAAVHTEWDVIEEGHHPYEVDLPRPWDPASCTARSLRQQLWEWLDQFVRWVNEECLWDPGDFIPPCWPQHPHLVHEIAVLAEQRRQAGRTSTAAALEHWQTHTLPAFLSRCHARLRRHCETGHEPTPGASAHSRYQALPEVKARNESFEKDLAPAADSAWRGE